MHTREVNEDIYTICNKQSVRRGRERNKLHTQVVQESGFAATQGLNFD